MEFIENTHVHCTLVLYINPHNLDKFHPQCDSDLPDDSVHTIMNSLLRNILVRNILKK